ncbi:MAG: maturase [Proteobacteria bacterium]|nr:maturase [Pseudomonadota bacterium]
MFDKNKARSLCLLSVIGIAAGAVQLWWGISEFYTPIEGIDSWIQRRFRMAYWKQWRHVRTPVGNLLRLKTPLQQAISTGSSGKGYWRQEEQNLRLTGLTFFAK